MMPLVIGPVSADFQAAATDVLREMVETAVPEVRNLMMMTRWELHDTPSAQQLALLSLPPSPAQVLLGLFTAPPPTIALFGRNIALIAHKEGTTLRAKTREVAIHELAQHRFGLNHVHEEPARGAAAYALPQSP